MFSNQGIPKSMVWLAGVLLSLVIAWGIWATAPETIAAQDNPFVTNTPPAPDPLVATPDAGFDHYALRLWTETDLVEVLISQISRLRRGEDSQRAAINLTWYELGQRFPGAPHHADQRERLWLALLNAPRGSVDLRPLARPLLVEELNATLGAINPGTENTLTLRGVMMQTWPVDWDGSEPIDALLQLRYPADATTDAELLYADFLPVIGSPDIGYTLLPIPFDLPAAPYDDITAMQLLRLEDLNGDTLTELALGVDTGDSNKELLIVGWRNGQISNLVAPGQTLLYAETPIWAADGSLTVTTYRVESAAWNCLSSRQERWEWSANYYRPEIAVPVEYRQFDTLGCDLLAAEPIFEQPLAEATIWLNDRLDGVSPDEPGYDRAQMALAMLYYLAGQTDAAQAQINALSTLAEDNPWLSGQISAFTESTANGVFDPLRVCAALLIQDDSGACNLDQVLTRIFTDNPIRRDADVVEQLRALGLPVLETTTISEVGHADRLVVHLDLTGAEWWAFAPLDRETYTVEPTDPPPGFGGASLPAQIELPASIYAILLAQQNPALALNTLDNVASANPGAPLSAEARYFQAFCSDMLADRIGARAAYYQLWVDFPGDTWGQLAGAHLERR